MLISYNIWGVFMSKSINTNNLFINNKFGHNNKSFCYVDGDMDQNDSENNHGDIGVFVKGNYLNFDDFIMDHPVGSVGDAYLIDSDLYIWSDNTDSWDDVGCVINSSENDYNNITSDQEIVSLIFKDSSLCCDMLIDKFTLFPDVEFNYSSFNVGDDNIILQPGFYEFSLSGKISTNITNSHGMFKIKDDLLNVLDMDFNLDSSEGKMMFFSRSGIYKFDSIDKINIECVVDNGACVSDVRLFIKRID